MTAVDVDPRTGTTALRPVTAVVAVMITASIPPFAVGAVAVQIGRTIDFSVADLGAGVAAYYLGSAVLSPTGGWLVVWAGPVACMRVATAAATAGIVVIATADSAAVIVAALALLGVPNAVVQPCANQVLVTVPERSRGLAFGLVQSAIPIATLIAGGLLALFSSGDAWRTAIWTVAGFTVVAQLVIGWASGAAPDEHGDDEEGPVAAAPELGGRPLVVALAVGAFAGSAAATTLPAFLASTGHHVGLAPSTIALAQIVGSASCALTRIAVGHVAGAYDGPANLVAVAGLMVAGSLGFALLSTSSGVAFGIGALLAYACGWGWNGLLNLTITKARPGRVAATTGITQGGIFLGGACGPFVFSRLLEAGGYRLAWGVTAGIAVLAAASLTVARQRWSRAEGTEGAA